MNKFSIEKNIAGIVMVLVATKSAAAAAAATTSCLICGDRRTKTTPLSDSLVTLLESTVLKRRIAAAAASACADCESKVRQIDELGTELKSAYDATHPPAKKGRPKSSKKKVIVPKAPTSEESDGETSLAKRRNRRTPRRNGHLVRGFVGS